MKLNLEQPILWSISFYPQLNLLSLLHMLICKVFCIYQFRIQIFYDWFVVGDITVCIQIPRHSLCFGKVYLESYFLEHLVDDADFLFKIILFTNMNASVIIIAFPSWSSYWPRDEKHGRCLLIVDSFVVWYGILKWSIQISSRICL